MNMDRFTSLWGNKCRAGRQGAAEFEMRSILGICERFRRGCNAV